jgi:methionyl aminopeptidase
MGLIKNAVQIQKMREVNKLTSSVFTMLDSHVIQGVTTDQLDKLVHDFIINELKARPAPLNYKGFPKSICTSLNHVVCHGIPDNTRLKDGDILNIDVSIEKDGFYGDTSKMYGIGHIKPHAQRLIDLTQEALYRAIREVKPGIPLNKIGKVIETFANKNHLSVVREFCGHGIGTEFHEQPQVLHYYSPEEKLILQEGMIFTIEPMINLGAKEIKILGDGWTVITKDRSLSAQWEHTILVTSEGAEILTLRHDEKY